MPRRAHRYRKKMSETGWIEKFRPKNSGSCEVWLECANNLVAKLDTVEFHEVSDALKAFSAACVAINLPKSIVRRYCRSVKNLVITFWEDPLREEDVTVPKDRKRVWDCLKQFYDAVIAPTMAKHPSENAAAALNVESHTPRKRRSRGRPPRTELSLGDYGLLQRWECKGAFKGQQRPSSMAECDRAHGLEGTGATARALRRRKTIDRRKKETQQVKHELAKTSKVPKNKSAVLATNRE